VTDLLPQTREQARARPAGWRSVGRRTALGQNKPGAGQRRFWHGKPVLQFVAAGLLVLAVLVLAIYWLAGRAALNEAVHDAHSRSTLLERSVIRPEMPRGLITSQPTAVAEFNKVVQRQVLGGWLVRVKIWDTSGRIVYSDDPRLIGQQFTLDAAKMKVLSSGSFGHVTGGLSHLDEPENKFEQASRKLYEAYAFTRSPEGQPLLFEAYYRYSDLSTRSNEVLSGFLPISIGGLLLFEIITLPLVWRLATRIRQGREERERLLRRAVDASDAERRRIAADLHDGVVQELAGASFALAAAAKSLHDEPAISASLDRVAAGVRQSMRSLRSTLVEIYPPNLHTEGLAAALGDLLAPLPGSGLSTSLEVPDTLDLGREVAAIVFRVAQEAVRNTQRHAQATVLTVKVTTTSETVILTVTDDGRGFDPLRGADQGHVGLRLLGDLAAEAGGTFEARSTSDSGTTIRLEVPR
jgi:two-component system NarL family sensor kinase